MIPSSNRSGIAVKDLLCSNSTENKTNNHSKTCTVNSMLNHSSVSPTPHSHLSNTSSHNSTLMSPMSHFDDKQPITTKLEYQILQTNLPNSSNFNFTSSTPNTSVLPSFQSSIRPHLNHNNNQFNPSHSYHNFTSPRRCDPISLPSSELSTISNPYQFESNGRSSSAPGSPNNNKTRGPWRSEEDTHLLALVERHGPSNWSTLSQYLPGRSGKQVRERYMNQLNPNLKKKNWTAEEDRLILEEHGRLGNKWSHIAGKLDGRTDNAVKNRYNSTLKRTITKRKEEGASIDIESIVRILHERKLWSTPIGFYQGRTDFKLEPTLQGSRSYATGNYINRHDGIYDRRICKVRRGTDSFNTACMTRRSSWSGQEIPLDNNESLYNHTWGGRACSAPSQVSAHVPGSEDTQTFNSFATPNFPASCRNSARRFNSS